MSNCLFSQIGGSTASGVSFGIAIYTGAEPGLLVKDNVISSVTGPPGAPDQSYGVAYGIQVRNAVSQSHYGVYAGKHQNNLTNNVTTPFTAGVDAGGNN